MLKPGLDLSARTKLCEGDGAGRFRSGELVNAERSSFIDVCLGSEFWQMLQKKRAKSFSSEQIAMAGDALSDAAFALDRAGRGEEAKAFWEWCECVGNITKMELRREEGGG